MTITLRPEHEQLITQVLETGAYASPDEVIGRALEILRGETEWLSASKTYLNEKIERAIAQIDRGEGIPGENLHKRLSERKTAWLTAQPPH